MSRKAVPNIALREGVYSRILDRIIDCSFPPGKRLVELDLTKELGVSRTPIREALIRLVREGLVVQDHNRGFSVAPLSVQEIEELYPILWTLEGLALQSLGPLASLGLAQLKDLNEKLAKAKTAARAQTLDTAWHEALVGRTLNKKLVEMISKLRLAIRRYEMAYMADQELVARSAQQHERVISALEKGDLDGAVSALQFNWQFGMQALLQAVRNG